MPIPAELPRTWDLTSYFPSFEGPEYKTFKSVLLAELKRALALATELPGLTLDSMGEWAALFRAYEDLQVRFGHLSSYLGNIGAADATNERCRQELAALSAQEATFGKLRNELERGCGSASDASWKTFLARPALRDAAYTLNRLRHAAKFRMGQAEEALAADLGVDGISAWGRLYDNLAGNLTFEMTWPDGRTKTVPMAQRRALITDPDPAVRATAFAASNAVWASHGEVLAAALNAIAGTRHTLYARRQQPSFLDQPYFDAAVSAETIDAMFAAIARNYELPRRVLQLGAKLSGQATMPFQDLDAPRPLASVPPIPWPEAVKLVDEAFGQSYPAMQTYFHQMLAQRWIESEVRQGKRPGGYCTGSELIKEERIYMSYADTMDDVNTLAHEVGHAWHSHLLGSLRPCARNYPMTLAETASTFAEMMLMHGLLSDPDLTPEKRVFLLDQETSRASAYLLNIPMRYAFEKSFYEERKSGEVSSRRLQELMVAAQREVFGETLETGKEDPWFWASKLHFFITEISFYNFPYTFGYLLSQALFAAYQEQGPAFLPKYEAFLRATGSADCEEAVRSTLGWDIRQVEFWEKAVQGLSTPISAFAAEVEAHLAKPVSP